MKRQLRHVPIALALVALLLGPSVSVGRAQESPTCPPGQALAFGPDLAALAERLGVIMGRPVECARPNPENGDILQQTSTGLAYVRLQTGTPTFTNGSEHWALTPGGLRCWAGASIDPPATSETLARFAPVAVGGAPGPWVAGQELPARISTAPFDVAGADVLAALNQRCLPIMGEEAATTAAPAWPPTIAEPGGPISKVSFRDARLSRRSGTCRRGCDVRDGGSVEVFMTAFQAERRREAASRGEASWSMDGEHAYVQGNLLLRLSARLTPEQAGQYEAALRDATGG